MRSRVVARCGGPAARSAPCAGHMPRLAALLTCHAPRVAQARSACLECRPRGWSRTLSGTRQSYAQHGRRLARAPTVGSASSLTARRNCVLDRPRTSPPRSAKSCFRRRTKDDKSGINTAAGSKRSCTRSERRANFWPSLFSVKKWRPKLTTGFLPLGYIDAESFSGR